MVRCAEFEHHVGPTRLVIAEYMVSVLMQFLMLHGTYHIALVQVMCVGTWGENLLPEGGFQA